MPRSVPSLSSALRAVALAAILGGQAACVRTGPVLSPTNTDDLALLSNSVRTPAKATTSDVPSNVVVRDYWGSPRASVVAWSDDEDWQGLRAAVLRDGTVAYDHTLYLSAYAVPNLAALRQANWYAFSDTAVGGHELQIQGVAADQFNCQGKKGCSPYVTFRARVPDALLRQTHDSLVVKVVNREGFETMIALRGDLIASYLATVDSVSAARKAKAASNHQ